MLEGVARADKKGGKQCNFDAVHVGYEVLGLDLILSGIWQKTKGHEIFRFDTCKEKPSFVDSLYQEQIHFEFLH